MRGLIAAIVVALQLPAVADTTEEAALVHLDRGVSAFNAKDFQRAHREFSSAHDLAPDKANPYRWLALTEIQLDDCGPALEHIDGFLSRVPPDDPRVAEMTRWREFCRREPAGQTQVTGTQALTTPPREQAPIHRRWWFWPVVGTTVVAVTGVTIYALTRTDSAMLPSIRCDATGCK